MDRICIKDLEIYCHHGVLEEETALGQKFLVSIQLYTDTKAAGEKDDLSLSVNYADICHFAERKMKEKDYKLIEAAAQHLAMDILLEFDRVDQAEVTIKKPWAPILLPLDTVSVTVKRGWKTVYLSIGSNLGDRQNYIEEALTDLRKDKKIRNVVCSSLLETKPYGYTDQPDSLNGAVRLRTLYSPEELLKRIHETEERGQRTREIHWGPRTIDLDILLYEDQVIETEELIIPHREMHKRMFVLEPLRQLAPWVRHPVLGTTVEKMYLELKEKDQ